MATSPWRALLTLGDPHFLSSLWPRASSATAASCGTWLPRKRVTESRVSLGTRGWGKVPETTTSLVTREVPAVDTSSSEGRGGSRCLPPSSSRKASWPVRPPLGELTACPGAAPSHLDLACADPLAAQGGDSNGRTGHGPRVAGGAREACLLCSFFSVWEKSPSICKQGTAGV